MPGPLSGPGLGLQLPQHLYPSELNNAPYDVGGPWVNLAPGQELPIAAGTWYVSCGMYSVLEYLDPITNTWAIVPNSAWMGGPIYVKSDGFNYRVANRLGCLGSVSVTDQGDANWVQASTTVTVTGSTAQVSAIVGGALALSGGTVRAVGAGYGVAPLVFIDPPANYANNTNGIGGIPATGYVTIANGTVTGFTFTNPGAGYQSVPKALVVPNPTDPNLSTGITAASVVFSLTNSGKITGAIVTNPGAPITPANITLTVAGAGASATLTPNIVQTVTAASVVGTISGLQASLAAMLSTVGGAPAQGSITNGPDYNFLTFRPRPAQVGLTIAGIGSLGPQVGTIYDGGLFMTNTAPNPVLMYDLPASSAATVTNAGTLTLTMGSRSDRVLLQPAP